MPAKRVRRIQDSVHGLMEFRGMETLVVDVLRTPEVQRLRRVRQLGLVHLVFPGAEHSRLVHSLGAAYLAVLFGRQLAEVTRGLYSRFLVPDEVAVRDLGLAALFHDLGHGPLSHAWEREIIGDTYDAAAWAAKLGVSHDPGGKRLKWHELVGEALLAWPEGQLHRLLEMHEKGSSERLRALLRGSYHIPYLPRLLASDIDVDRADFLKRDTLHCGVGYGGIDLPWLLSTAQVGITQGKELVFGFDRQKSLRAVEQFLIARRALYESVYHHKTVRAAEGMVALFLRRLKEVAAKGGLKGGGDRLVAPLVKMVSGETVGQEELLSADDFALSVLIDRQASESDDPVVLDLGRRIMERDLFKVVPCPSARVNEFLRQADAYPRIYRVIEKHYPGAGEYYLIIDNARFKMLASRDDEWGYFIDDEYHATPMREHEAIRPLWGGPQESVRLFAPRETVEELTQIIG